MKITVRDAKTEDAPRIVTLLGKILKFHHNGRPDLFKDCGGKYDVDEICAKINGNSDIILTAADENDCLIGYAICQLKSFEGAVLVSRKTLYLDDLCVDEEYRGQGIGSALLEAVKQKACELKCYNVELNVWSFNSNARGLYEKCGYTEQSRHMELILNCETK